jgi:hypothetical protein
MASRAQRQIATELVNFIVAPVLAEPAGSTTWYAIRDQLLPPTTRLSDACKNRRLNAVASATVRKQ